MPSSSSSGVYNDPDAFATLEPAPRGFALRPSVDPLQARRPGDYAKDGHGRGFGSDDGTLGISFGAADGGSKGGDSSGNGGGNDRGPAPRLRGSQGGGGRVGGGDDYDSDWGGSEEDADPGGLSWSSAAAPGEQAQSDWLSSARDAPLDVFQLQTFKFPANDAILDLLGSSPRPPWHQRHSEHFHREDEKEVGRARPASWAHIPSSL